MIREIHHGTLCDKLAHAHVRRCPQYITRLHMLGLHTLSPGIKFGLATPLIIIKHEHVILLSIYVYLALHDEQTVSQKKFYDQALLNYGSLYWMHQKNSDHLFFFRTDL